MLSDKERKALVAGIANHGGPFGRVPQPPAELWRALEQQLRPMRLAKGEFLVRPGEASGSVGLVRSGMLRFFYTDTEGAEYTKAFRGPGEMAAAFAELLLGVPSRTHIQALEDAELLVCDYARLDHSLSRFPSWQPMARLIAEHFYVVKERREFELLQLSAEDRYRRFAADYPDLMGRIPQYCVASYLGITPVALSRIVSRLRKTSKKSGKRR
jgi:CRP-like cAMP-binding protein